MPFLGSSTLEECKITENTALTVLNNTLPTIDEQNSGKSSLEDGMGLSTLPFVNFKDPQDVLFDKGAPKWRTVKQGLNLEGKCKNSTCPAHNQWVCAPQGMATFYMHETCAKAVCPSCNKPLEKTSTNNCILWNCFYTIEGMEENTEIPVRAQKPMGTL